MAVTINGTTGIETNTDTGKVKLGVDDDLTIEHNGTDSVIDNNTGALHIKSNTSIAMLVNNTEDAIVANANGEVKLYYDNSKKLETLAGGAKVNSSAAATAEFGIQAASGQNAELWLLSDAGNQYGDKVRLLQDDGVLSTQFNTASNTWENSIKCTANGNVELYYNSTKRFETKDTGAEVTGTIQAYKDKSDSAWPENAYHVFQIDTAGTATHIIENSSNGNPYGGIVHFSDGSPDNHTNYFLKCFDSSASRCEIYSDGDVWTSDDSYLSSDETLKENIVDATPKLEDLKKLKVRNFNWKSSYHPEKCKQKQIGFIAQEVEQVFPALIDEHDVAPGLPDDGHTPVMKKAIKTAWNPIIIKAMQELIAKVETLETKVAALEAA